VALPVRAPSAALAGARATGHPRLPGTGEGDFNHHSRDSCTVQCQITSGVNWIFSWPRGGQRIYMLAIGGCQCQ